MRRQRRLCRLYARQAYQTKKDSLSQPATAARNLRYETDATIARRFANFAAKASPAFGVFYRFSDSTPIDVSSSTVINGSTAPMPFDKFVNMKISRGCRNYYLPFCWPSRRTRSCRVAIPLQPNLVRKHSGRIPERAAKSLMSPLEQKAQKTTRFSQAPRSVIATSRSLYLA